MAIMLGVSEVTLEKRRNQGLPPEFVRVGRLVGYTDAALDAFIKANTFTSTGEYASKPKDDLPVATTKLVKQQPAKRSGGRRSRPSFRDWSNREQGTPPAGRVPAHSED